MQKMTAPSKMGRKHELNLILYRRDRARPCPQRIIYYIKSTDNRKGCPYGRKCFQICYIPKAIINTLISSAAASHRPTPLDVISNPCEAPTSFHFFTLISSLPIGLMSLLLRKRWTNRFESCRKSKQKK